MKKRMVCLVLSSAALSAMLFGSFKAQALTEVTRASAFRCALLESARYSEVDGLDAVPTQVGEIPMGIKNAGIDAPRAKMACPMDDIASMALSITSVKAHIQDNSPHDWAWAITCTQFATAEGGSCAAGKRNGSASVTGDTTITLTTNWPTQAASGFPYLYVELPFTGPKGTFLGYTASKD